MVIDKKRSGFATALLIGTILGAGTFAPAEAQKRAPRRERVPVGARF